MTIEDQVFSIDRSSCDVCLEIGTVLHQLQDSERLTPKDIAQNRLRESLIRLDLQRLQSLGLAESVGADHFRITTDGKSTDPVTKDIKQQYVEHTVLNGDQKRVTDVEFLTSYQIKRVNLRYLEEENQEYGLILNSYTDTESRILNQHGKRIYRILREFPYDFPLISQCAHWMRAIAGLHWFPDANHRTGMTLLEIILDRNDLDSDPLPGRFRNRGVLRSKLLRLLHINSTTLCDLWKRDIYYQHWYEYFLDVFDDTRTRYNASTSIQKLKNALGEARGREFV